MIYDYEYGEMYEPVREPKNWEVAEFEDEDGKKEQYYFEDGEWWTE